MINYLFCLFFNYLPNIFSLNCLVCHVVLKPTVASSHSGCLVLSNQGSKTQRYHRSRSGHLWITRLSKYVFKAIKEEELFLWVKLYKSYFFLKIWVQKGLIAVWLETFRCYLAPCCFDRYYINGIQYPSTQPQLM